MAPVGAKSYYDLLGVAENASQDDVRKAYHKLAHKYHPDKTGGNKAAEAKLKEINEAYDTLKNPEKRKQYDAELHSPFGAGGFRTGQAGQRGAGGFGGFDFSGGSAGGFGDIFEDLFGGGGARTTRRHEARKGHNLSATISVTLREAAAGVKKALRVPHAVACDTCHGSGAAPGTSPQACPQCGGTGKVAQGGGSFFISQACPRCHGAGQFIPSPCRSCSGTGRTTKMETVSVNIPAGARDGMRLRIAGRGEPGESGAANGDLYIVVNILPDKQFVREDNDIIVEVPVGFTDAALGARIRVPTLNGQAELNIPKGTQSGQTFRLRGLGLPGMNGRGQGDQLVRVTVQVPKNLSEEQERLIRELKKSGL